MDSGRALSPPPLPRDVETQTCTDDISTMESGRLVYRGDFVAVLRYMFAEQHFSRSSQVDSNCEVYAHKMWPHAGLHAHMHHEPHHI